MASDFESLMRRAATQDHAAVDELFAVLYDELRRLAERNLRRVGAPPTLGATTLLHEAYLNVAGRDGLVFADRAGFLAYASRAMRGLVVDYARRRRALKRGRGIEITLVEEVVGPGSDGGSAELVQLGEAVEWLGGVAPALAELVDLHFFCGFTFAEIGELRGVTERTVQRDWRKARLLLHDALAAEPGGP